MSYILDALRKAEHERQLGDAPRLTFAPLSETANKRPWLLWGVVVVLTLIVAVLGYLQLTQGVHQNPVAVAEEAQAIPAPPPPPPAAPPVQTAATTPKAPSPARRVVQVNTPSGPVEIDMPLTGEQATVPTPKAAPKPRFRPMPEPEPEFVPRPPPPSETKPAPRSAPPVVEPAEKPQAVADSAAAPEKADAGSKLLLPSAAELAAAYENNAALEEPAPVSSANDGMAAAAIEPEPEPVTEARLPSYLGLPASTRSSVGELVMNAHVYSSSPGRGFVIINGRRYRAGDTLEEGPVLDEIQQSGAVLNYRGQRFLLPVPR